MITRFRQREESDVARVHDVLAFARGRGCLTRALLAHFGESLMDDCGHCDRCLGSSSAGEVEEPERKLGAAELELVKGLLVEGHAALATARQMTRFRCGLTSPATTRARLTRDARFGELAQVPFDRVLQLVEDLKEHSEVGGWNRSGPGYTSRPRWS